MKVSNIAPSRWFATGIIVNIALAVAFEVWRPRGLSYDGLWNARTGFWAGLLLLDNLCVLWWYATTTHAQLALTQAEFKESHRRLLVAQKPVVYTERAEHPEHPGRVNYWIRNAGGGPAINVYYLGLFDLAFQDPIALGAVAADDARVLPAAVKTTLHNGDAGIKFVLLAEAPYTRTTQWTPTLNIRT